MPGTKPDTATEQGGSSGNQDYVKSKIEAVEPMAPGTTAGTDGLSSSTDARQGTNGTAPSTVKKSTSVSTEAVRTLIASAEHSTASVKTLASTDAQASLAFLASVAFLGCGVMLRRIRKENER